MTVLVRRGQHSVADRFDAYREVVSSTFVPLEATSAAPAAFDCDLAVEALGPLHLADVRAGQNVVRRTPRLIRASDSDSVKLTMQVRGYSVLTQDGREAALTPGDFTVYDTSRPYELRFDNEYRVLVMMIPRSVLRVPAQRLASLTARRISGSQGLGAVVAPFLLGLREQIGAPDPVVGLHLSNAVLDLLAAAFSEQVGAGSEVTPETRRHALLLNVHAFIDARLDDPDLDPATVAAAHHVSPSYLQKLFAGEGTSVSSWIRQRRLEQCHRDLLDPQYAEVPVSAVAARWGLHDPAHFSRLFKAAYGLSPREHRASASDLRRRERTTGAVRG